MANRALSLVVAGLLLVTSAAAQSPEQRAEVERYRQLFAVLDDSVTLKALEAAMIERAMVDRDNALLHLKLGFLAHRLGEVTEEKPHYDDAGSEFEWAAELQPDWPYPWYGLGMAEYALGERDFIPFESLRQALGKDYLSKSASAFARAAEADPSFADAVVDLAGITMRQRIHQRLGVALAVVRRAAATDAGGSSAVQLARGRLEREAGEGDSALTAFRRYLAVGGDSGIGYLELARTLYYTLRSEEGEARYYAGAGLARSPEAVALYRGDLSWVATEDELAAFDSVPRADRSEWLRRFWEKRDAADVRRPGERLEEHYRRYFYAWRHYRLVTRHRRYDVVDAYRNDQQVFDDRGVIYLRHGEPRRRAFYNAQGVNANVSWLYDRPGEDDLIFHFVAREDVQDYKLVESLTDVFGMEAAIELQTGAAVDRSFAERLFESRVGLHPIYQRLQFTSSAGHQNALALERKLGDEAIAVGTTTDSYALRFETSLKAVTQHYVVSDSTGHEGRLLMVFAIPSASLAAQELGERVAYPVQMRLVASGPADTAVVFVDTTRVFTASGRLGPNDHLSAYLEVPIAQGDYAVRLVLAQPWWDAGELVRWSGVTVPDFTADELTVSDLVVGRSGSGLTWVAHGEPIGLNPLRYYPKGSELQLHYEIHGLPRDAPYRTRVEVGKKRGGGFFGFFKKLFGGGGPPISLTFEGVATETVTRVTQTVDISDLKPGEYRLRLTVEQPDGNRRVVRETVLNVTE